MCVCVSSLLSKWFCSGGPDVFGLAQLTTKWPGCLALSVSQHLCVFIFVEVGQSDSDSLISCRGSHAIPLDRNEITQTHTCAHTNTHNQAYSLATMMHMYAEKGWGQKCTTMQAHTQMVNLGTQ